MRVAGARAADHRSRLVSFEGAVVTSVTAWRHGVSLAFNDEARAINIEGQADVSAGGRLERYPVGASVALAKRLLDLVGRCIERITVSEDGALVVAFDEEFVLRAAADETGYESYVVSFPDEFILAG